jgi:hypothetical protein
LEEIMKKHMLLSAIIVVKLLFAGTVYAEQFCYVQSATAKILSSPSFSAKTIAEARMGEKLGLKKTEKSWVTVVYDGEEGYVSSLLVSSHPPIEKRRFIKETDPKIERGVRRRSSSFASAAAARGLTREDRMRADMEGAADYQALEKMESLSFGDDDLTRFVKGGKP